MLHKNLVLVISLCFGTQSDSLALGLENALIQTSIAPLSIHEHKHMQFPCLRYA